MQQFLSRTIKRLRRGCAHCGGITLLQCDIEHTYTVQMFCNAGQT